MKGVNRSTLFQAGFCPIFPTPNVEHSFLGGAMMRTLKESGILIFISIVTAFAANYFSPVGIALIGQWDAAQGVVTAFAKNDNSSADFEIGDLKLAKEMYDLFPSVLINLIAIIVPFVEIIAGLALIGGIYPRAAALVLNAMLGFFIVILSYNLFRGHEFDCGCFALEKTGLTSSTEFTLFRDFVYLALGLQVFYYQRSRRWSVTK
jgi:hypothetical protein